MTKLIQRLEATMSECIDHTAKRVAVFGPSSHNIGPQAYVRLHELGKRIAMSDYELITGGAAGTLAVVCRGYYEQSGIKPEAFYLDNISLDHCDLEVAKHHIVSGGLLPRFGKLLTEAQAFVCLPPRKSKGTLHEFAETLCLMGLGEVPERPFIVFDLWGDFGPIVEYVLKADDLGKIKWANNVSELMSFLG